MFIVRARHKLVYSEIDMDANEYYRLATNTDKVGVKHQPIIILQKDWSYT
jgi:hypothetical protein